MNFFEVVIYHGLSALVRALSILSPGSGEKAAGVIGKVWFGLDKKRRQITLANIALAYGPDLNQNQRQNLAKAVFKNSVKMFFEYARFSRLFPGQRSKELSVRGLCHLSAAHAKGKGVLCFSCHMGNWEAGTYLSPMVKTPFIVVYRRLKFKPLDRYIKEKRSSSGTKMVTMHKALDKVLEGLDSGELIGLIIDQNVRQRSRGVFVDFFGRKACANTGLARLALSTRAPVVPIFCYREGGKCIIEILPEMPLVRTGDETRDIFENTQSYNTLIETYVRKHPDQWFWIHNRWRTRPLSEKKAKGQPVSTPKP